MAHPKPQPLATATVNLAPYNTIALTASTPTNLKIVGGGKYYMQMCNLGAANVFIKGDSSVLATDVASFKLLPNQTFTPLVAGGLWVLADAAGSLTVALMPKP
jgi:hypothetical protein